MHRCTFTFLILAAAIMGGCSGGGGSTTASPTGASNSVPRFTSFATASVSENSAGVVYMAAAVDADGDALSFGLSGSDATSFNIDTTTGQVSYINPPDFEAPADANSDNAYDITITVSDGSTTAQLNVTVSVTALDESPEFTGQRKLSVLEGSRFKLIINPDEPESNDVMLKDPEGENVRVLSINQFLSGPDAAMFIADESTRDILPLDKIIITNREPFDFENPKDADGNNIYEFDVNVTDGVSSASGRFEVEVVDRSGGSFFREQGVAVIVGAEIDDSTGNGAVSLMRTSLQHPISRPGPRQREVRATQLERRVEDL